MKKVFALLVILLLGMILVSCRAEYTYKFVDDDGTVLLEGKGEKGSEIKVPTNPNKESTAEFTYEFIGWDKEVGVLEENIVFTAQYKEIKRKYTYKFVNYDGTVLNEETVEYGVMPAEPTTEPVKSTTPEHTYEFTGWDKEIKAVTEDVVYIAQFKEVRRKYTYKFVNYDGTVLNEETVEYGVMPAEPTTEPVKSTTPEHTYEFTGWDKEIKAVTEDVVYTAQFKELKRKYTCKFVNYDGSILKEEKVEYGTMPVAPSNPTRPEDLKASYTFNGWDIEISEVLEDVTYTATYTMHAKAFKFSELAGKRISILGDSISTFYQAGSSMNSYYSQEGRFYYPTYCADVKTVEKTWWGQLINNTNMILGINNSWSGSTAIGTNESAGCSDARLNTLIENGDPDIIILYLGTNDVCAGNSPEAFIEAYETILSKLSELCVAQIYVCTLGYSEYKGMKYTDANRVLYNEAIRAFATKHNLGVIPLDEYVMEDNYKLYLNDYLHYKYKGTTLLSQIFEKSLCEFNDIEYTKEVEVEHPVPEPKGHITIGSYNNGVWDKSIYPNKVLLYSYDSLNQGSTYKFYYLIKIKKDGDNYKITGKKDYNVVETFEECEYYIMINADYPSHKFFDDVNVGDYLKLTGDITSGNCEFTLIE